MERVIERCSDGEHVYLRIRGQENIGAEDLYEIKMISANQPAGLLEMHLMQENGQMICEYHVTGLRSLKDSEGDEVQVDYLYSLITAMAREAEIFSEFMLDPAKLCLSPETIFFRQWTGEVFFCYDPGKTESLQESMQRLMEYFLKKLDPKDEEDILFMYGLYQRTREPMVTLASLHEEFLANREKYLKIGEKREEKQKAAAEAAPEVNTEAIAEDSVYEDLGIEKPQRAVSFSFLKKEAPEVYLDLDSYRDRSRVREAAQKDDPEPVPAAGEYDWDTGSRKQMPEPASDRKDLDPAALFGRLRPYGFELAVGGVVLAGVILFILI